MLANSGSYGIYAQLNREDLRVEENAKVRVFGAADPFECSTRAPELPGPFTFPPIAALITAGARLMLAHLERTVVDRGGHFALCDTDSMAIVANASGGIVACPGGSARTEDGQPGIRALSWAEVDAIVERFAALNPYDRTVVPGSILKIEQENFANRRREQLHCFAISAKRYALWNRGDDGSHQMRKCSEHGLGHLLNPLDSESESVDWIEEFWRTIIAEALGTVHRAPTWLTRPALGRLSIPNPDFLRPFKQKKGMAYRRQMKPFNFGLVAHVASFGYPPGVDPKKFQLIAPYDRDPRNSLGLSWRDKHSGQGYRIVCGERIGTSAVRVKSYADVLAEYRSHPEAKSAAVEDSATGRTARGLLARRHVTAEDVTYIGKESNDIENVALGTVHNQAEVVTSYT